MATYIVGFDGKWQERFDDREEAIAWAKDVADTGRTVEVVIRRFGFHGFLTGFPESEREALAARWRMPWFSGGANGAGGHSHYDSAHGGHGGGWHGGGHGGGH